jgi:hypothetical protein
MGEGYTTGSAHCRRRLLPSPLSDPGRLGAPRVLRRRDHRCRRRTLSRRRTAGTQAFSSDVCMSHTPLSDATANARGA